MKKYMAIRQNSDGSVSFSESFDPDDPALIDRYPVTPQKQALDLVTDRQHPHNEVKTAASERLAKKRKICPQYLIR